MTTATLGELRTAYHTSLKQGLWGIRQRNGDNWYKEIEGHSYPVFSNADGHNAVSVLLCAEVASRLKVPTVARTGQGSTSGSDFERCTSVFVSDALALFAHLNARQLITTPPATTLPSNRPIPSRVISRYSQFEHLGEIQDLIQDNPQLEAALGGDYLVKPDILVLFEPFSDEELNAGGAAIDRTLATFTPTRSATGGAPILHASISCKWTMRRDRAQNTRLEALNLVRNRKGRLPHVAAVTMECDPEILGSLCLGTGDIDCIYHGALLELIDAADIAAQRFGGAWTTKLHTLTRMVDGSRLRDIADLPLDLLI